MCTHIVLSKNKKRKIVAILLLMMVLCNTVRHNPQGGSCHYDFVYVLANAFFVNSLIVFFL